MLLAQSNHVESLALTDINTTSACLDFVRLSSRYNIKPVLGVDFRNGADQKFVLLAKNNEGFQKINSYLSQFLHQKEMLIPYYSATIADTYVIYPFQTYQGRKLGSNEYLGVRPQDINRLRLSKWNNRRDKLIVLQTVSFRNKQDFNTHRLLRAIDNNTLLSKLSKTEEGDIRDKMLTKEELVKIFQDFPELIANTQYLLNSCAIEFDFTKEHTANQKSYTKSEEEDYSLLKSLSYDGLAYRYKQPNKIVLERLEKELKMIKEKGFVSYFLMNWRILTYARSKDYYYVGRGSGANSIIAYLLRITDVDPIDLDLYFERFINLYRKNPPDFDIDFSWTDRDDITDFIFKTFKHTALITVYNTFKKKAALRELGKVFGLPKSEIDALTRGQLTADGHAKYVLKYSELIQGFPNYLGIHDGGILISEKPIHYYTATFMPPKGFATTQFDMVTAEDIGLYKFDILSQRGLGKIKDTVKIVAYNRPNEAAIDIHDIARFKADEKIKSNLKNAKAIGCFYVESPAMRMLLKKLQVDSYLGLVAASSIIRPGVAKSGMMREYILRHRYPEKRKNAHPILLEIMPETYGVMVYQEDVIKVAHYFGGLTLGEADMLRRGMSGKFRSRAEFEKVKKLFFKNCQQKGHSRELTTEVWRQIESFAGYAFAKGHSASYAVESYQSLFLKAYYPLEYMVATINNGGGFYAIAQYVHEAKMHGAIVYPPCINEAWNQTTIQGKEIYLGFMLVQSLTVKIVNKIVVERVNNGIYKDLDDFIDRINISLDQVAILIKVNAFRFTQKNKRELLWEAHMKIRKVAMEEHVVTLFKSEKNKYKIPSLDFSEMENAFDEIELLSFPLCNPFDLLLEPLAYKLKAKDLEKLIGKRIAIAGYLVTLKQTKTVKGHLMYFGNFLDRSGDFIDTVHFPNIAYHYPFRGKGIYVVVGIVKEEFGCITVEVSKMERLAIIEDPRYSDFKKQKNIG